MVTTLRKNSATLLLPKDIRLQRKIKSQNMPCEFGFNNYSSFKPDNKTQFALCLLASKICPTDRSDWQRPKLYHFSANTSKHIAILVTALVFGSEIMAEHKQHACVWKISP